MEYKDIYDVIIVGGGPSGLAAGLYCQRAALKTVLFEKGLIGGQIAISKDVENYPGVEGITGFDLAEKLHHHAKAFGLTIIQEEVAAIHAGEELHAVQLANGDTFHTMALILAAGGSVRKLGIPGEAQYLGSGVSYCATCDGFFFRDKNIVVVGGGDTAVEESIYLSKLVRRVVLVHRRSVLRAKSLLQQRLMSDPRIELRWNTVLKSIEGNGRHVVSVVAENIETGETSTWPVDGVFIFIGYSPNVALVPEGVLVNELGYVITDEKCQTNIPGIYAVGDIRKKFANQIIIAAGDGAVAALAAARYVETWKSGELSQL